MEGRIQQCIAIITQTSKTKAPGYAFDNIPAIKRLEGLYLELIAKPHGCVDSLLIGHNF